jgi:hypothetical protein
MITRPEESYRLWCVVVCDLETSRMIRHGYRVFRGGKELPGRDADPSASSGAVVMKE